MSGFIEVTPELMAGFMDEAPGYLSALDEGILEFETKAAGGPIDFGKPDNQARMNEMFRAAHSFKGLAATMGFDKVRDLTHVMETLFDQIRMGERSLDAASIQTLFGVIDTLRALIAELNDPQSSPVDIQDALAQLNRILESPASDPAAAPVAVPEPGAAAFEPTPVAEASGVAETTAVAAGSRPFNSVMDDPALAQMFIDTTLETLEALSGHLLKLEETPNDVNLLNEIFRAAHNIKGATGAVGLQGMYRLTHDMETVLDQLRSCRLTLDERLVNALFAAVDRLRSDIHLVRKQHYDSVTEQGTREMFAAWTAPEAGQPEAQSESPAAEVVAASGDQAAVSVKVTFPPGFIESEIQAYLIHNRLNELGDVLGSEPAMDALDGSATVEQIVYRVRTSQSADEIKSAVQAYAVKSVEVSMGHENADAPSMPTAAAANAVAVHAAGAAIPESSAPPALRPTNAPAKPVASVGAANAAQAPGAVASSTAAAAAVSKTTGGAGGGARPGETIRVDLERLDQLMNLGGELVINRARFVQIQSRFEPIFRGGNLRGLVEELTERVDKLGGLVRSVSGTCSDPHVVREMSDHLVHLTHDFGSVRELLGRVRDARGAMNDYAEALHNMNRVSDGLQKGIMATRMVSIGPLFQRFRRVVRDIAKSTHKDVDLILRGESTELDKRMIDELGDPLTHMVRNSVDHGIELPDNRERAGKPRMARVTLDAYHRGRYICIEVRDDGRGIDVDAVRQRIIERELATAAQVEAMTHKELIQWVFKPGFSTAKTVTDLSGRGMGMDIVVTKIESLNGTVEIDSTPGKGTVVTIKLPLTLAILTSLLTRVGSSVWAVPLETVAEIITVPRKNLLSIQKRRVVRLRNRVIPVAFFEEIFQSDGTELHTVSRQNTDLTLVILTIQNELLALVVDETIGQEDIVIKSIAANYRNVAGIVGASIMGDGKVSLILDTAAAMSMFAERGAARRIGDAEAPIDAVIAESDDVAPTTDPVDVAPPAEVPRDAEALVGAMG
ncbi:MAG: chemotaxis protein CheA [Phycisphaerales bacterium]|nr:chemotaxis protein CheA [Phycisphaerales bacterium]